MSCNGCRVLRKGCSDSCLLRPCLQWIGSAEAQGHATLFVAKFFGRAGLMSFISAVPPLQRPALFQSLLFEACGRTINPVDGAVGLLGSGNWHLCQAAVEMVLRGGSLCPIPEFAAEAHTADRPHEAGHRSPQRKMGFSSVAKRRKNPAPPDEDEDAACDLDLCLTPRFPSGGGQEKQPWRSGTPSMNSEGSVTTISGESSRADRSIAEPRLLNLFL